MRIAKAVLGWSAPLGVALMVSSPVQATGLISCADMKADSSVDILLGAGPVSNVLSVNIAMGERELTTDPNRPGEKVSIAQAYDDGEIFRIDLVDDQATTRMAIVRLVRREHQSMPLQLGIVQIENEPPVGVSCVGP